MSRLRRRTHEAAFRLAATLAFLLCRLRAFVRRPGKKAATRSLWMGAPIITMATNARAERLLGVRADSLVYETYYITDRFTYNLSHWMKVPMLRSLVPYAVLVWACARYQRFHFYCDRGILQPMRRFEFNPAELQLLHSLGKEVFFWTYGADVRTRERTVALGEPNCCTHCQAVGEACVCDERAAGRNLARIRRCAAGIFAMGDMIEYVPGSRNDLFFWPVDLGEHSGRKYAPQYPKPHDGPMRIVHASNHRHYKGTDYLIRAVDELRREGCDVELVLVERVPNDKALEVYRTADVIFDQCLVGSFGFFAIEAMALGKPVMCFIRRPDAYLLDADECPIIRTEVSRLKRDILELSRRRDRLGEIGRKSRRYVEKHFTLEAFAGRLRAVCGDAGAEA